jgi:hypothetical protein
VAGIQREERPIGSDMCPSKAFGNIEHVGARLC